MNKYIRMFFMKMSKPKPGELFVVINERLHIAGGIEKEDIPVLPNSIVMFLEHETYVEALKEIGFDYDKMMESECHFPRDEPFWKCLVFDHVTHLPVEDAVQFLKPASPKKKAKV